MTGNPEPHLTFDQVRKAAHLLGEKRRAARADYEHRTREAAEAERDYRKTKAIAFTKARDGEKGVGESEIIADHHSADARYRRDIAQSMVKASLLRIEELEADRAMLRQLGDWSQRMEGG